MFGKGDNMEIWEVLDKDRNSTGKSVTRGTPLKEDEYHLVVDIWIRNSKNKY